VLRGVDIVEAAPVELRVAIRAGFIGADFVGADFSIGFVEVVVVVKRGFILVTIEVVESTRRVVRANSPKVGEETEIARSNRGEVVEVGGAVAEVEKRSSNSLLLTLNISSMNSC